MDIVIVELLDTVSFLLLVISVSKVYSTLPQYFNYKAVRHKNL